MTPRLPVPLEESITALLQWRLARAEEEAPAPPCRELLLWVEQNCSPCSTPSDSHDAALMMHSRRNSSARPIPGFRFHAGRSYLLREANVDTIDQKQR